MGAEWILVVGFAVLGLCLGSFLNVCILRLWHEDRKKRSLLHPPSTCPQCKQRIAWRDNIPVFSWLWLRGKCRWCHKRISIQYPIIEAGVGVLWVVGVALNGIGLVVHSVVACMPDLLIVETLLNLRVAG